MDYTTSPDTRSPCVSVIIANYNGKPYLEQALVALRDQTFRDFEAIVVDNASTDGSPQLVASEFPQVELVSLDENSGFAKANNIGIGRARGEFIALLNNDAMPAPSWLEELIAAARRHPEAGFFASQVELYYQPGLLDSAGDELSTAGTVFRRGHLQPAANYSQEEYVFGAQACAALYRRELLQRVGLLDEDFFCVYEDADLSYRAQLAGYKCLYVPRGKVRHRGGSTIGRFSRTYVYQSHRNVEYLLVKDLPTPILLRVLPAHAFYNLMAFVFFASQGQGPAFVQAKWDALCALPRLMAKRRRIQSELRVSSRDLMSQMRGGWFSRVLREKAPRLAK
jgi:GT2 family glycosyltransferase